MSHKSLLVFSHPNHEIAILSLIENLKPTIVYLTDGGGEQRVSETRESLRRIGAGDRAHFLNHTEASFYEAILTRNAGFFRRVRDELLTAVAGQQIDAAFCDAVEFYNPVHDIALPVLASARLDVPLFEVPLIQQDYAGQIRMVTAPVGSTAETLEPSQAQKDRKLAFLSEVYVSLGRYLSGLSNLDVSYALQERYYPARPLPIEPAAGEPIRYDARGKLLVEQGEYREAITHAGNYRPLVRELLAV